MLEACKYDSAETLLCWKAVEEFNLYFRAMAWQVATRVPTKAATVPTNGTSNTR